MEAIRLVDATEKAIHDIPAAFMVDPESYRSSADASYVAAACADLRSQM